MKLKLIAATIVLSAASLAAGPAFAQQQATNATAPVAQGQSQAAAPTNRGGFGNFGSTSLMCLEWHCQGSECICIRFTTAQVVQN
ncbi:hypothetical protein PRN20_13200 [Devosia sp. ZB163]|uniref:hypothetical protein n=1 Tax=Devosia sp. ZB163 TaxID=3025938 RepID=UPI0023616CD2|nr:hypothetical protein [Devosia sp. ZB163]MDC9824690.1 hypothetical protein [Devosia sp. ZB163]